MMSINNWVMKGLLFPVILSLLLVAGCRPNIEVRIVNQTQDNISLDTEALPFLNLGAHLEQGKEMFVGSLEQDLNETMRFKICRSYGCPLATITIRGIKWPDPEAGESSYKDWVVIEEPVRNEFTAYALLDLVAVSVTNQSSP
jgi:hypothetical protein